MQDFRSTLADSLSSSSFLFVPPQKRKQGRITFDTMDFVAEEVCITLTLLAGNFLSA